MEKNILILSSSPRKGGNSDLLCDAFLQGAQKGGNKAEKVFLQDYTIHYCTGCGVCNSRKGQCSQHDDAAEVLEKMVQADVIVLATPVYFYTLAAQLKTLIDRCCARYTEMSGKEFYFIVTAAVGQKAKMERTLEALRGFTSCLTDAREIGIVYGLGVWGAGEVKNTAAESEAHAMGKNA